MSEQSGYYSGYAQQPTRSSPISSRTGFNTVSGLPSAMRPQQRHQIDSFTQGSASLFPVEDRFNPYESNSFRQQQQQHRAPPTPGFPTDNYIGNAQAWAYNGANTVNGAMGDSRLRPSASRRAALPTEWTMSGEQGLGSQALNTPSTQYSAMANFNNQNMGMISGDGYGSERHGFANGMYDPRHDAKSMSSDLIPTAIVIKNIPFNVRKEMLTSIMSDLGLPQPYAFNYHFDNGIFRGLAFANFQSPLDTQTVIEQLNGYEVQGRKLRVEYKKMLPEHERERIEREKREKRGQLEEQHQPLTLQHQSSMHSLNTAHSTRSRTSPLRDVDLNNPDTLQFYTELTLFRNDPNREILVFPSTITPHQRRTVHILAHNMGLEHRSVGEGPQRQLHVLKESAPPASLVHNLPGVSADAHRRGLSRAATIDFAETRNSGPGHYATMGRSSRHGPTLELPDSPDGGLNALRGVKSFADLRSYTPSPSLSSTGFPQAGSVAQYGEYSANLAGQNSSLTTPTTPGTNSNNDPSMLIPDLSGMTLSENFGSNRLRPRDAPGAIGSQRPVMNGSSTRSIPERQPLGPNGDWGEGMAGFAARGRANGHMQRGSESSDTAVRSATTSAARFQ
ncbi:Putative similar to RNA-binding post-transcriptional regulator cip2 of Schizosaccharomyces pombe [Podospora comata]|uniref:Similar to RNA-binding post-transcriptional regulator cip2 of Schizosaccharomyces pombe n=1 Tax=Podospora comata TaxID=48703 RepID=A0ABY6SFJ9_PODCO|nr:Putative similar to RNA-binding post-transcriptional regulator cip2 of Schizosaccharomyces pombe [Podospora comata]